MKKLGFLTQLVPGILVPGMAWAGLAHSTPVFKEVTWPEKPVLEKTISYDSTEEDARKQGECIKCGRCIVTCPKGNIKPV